MSGDVMAFTMGSPSGEPAQRMCRIDGIEA